MFIRFTFSVKSQVPTDLIVSQTISRLGKFPEKIIKLDLRRLLVRVNSLFVIKINQGLYPIWEIFRCCLKESIIKRLISKDCDKLLQRGIGTILCMYAIFFAIINFLSGRSLLLLNTCFMKHMRSMDCPLILSSLSTPLTLWFITDFSWNIPMLLINIYAVDNTRCVCISKNQDDPTVIGENSFNLYKTAHKDFDISKF